MQVRATGAQQTLLILEASDMCPLACNFCHGPWRASPSFTPCPNAGVTIGVFGSSLPTGLILGGYSTLQWMWVKTTLEGNLCVQPRMVIWSKPHSFWRQGAHQWKERIPHAHEHRKQGSTGLKSRCAPTDPTERVAETTMFCCSDYGSQHESNGIIP